MKFTNTRYSLKYNFNPVNFRIVFIVMIILVKVIYYLSIKHIIYFFNLRNIIFRLKPRKVITIISCFFNQREGLIFFITLRNTNLNKYGKKDIKDEQYKNVLMKFRETFKSGTPSH